MKIAVFTCDLYADAVPAFHYLWYKHWPDCPYPLVYCTNRKKLDVDAPVVYIKGKDIDFSWRFRKFVGKHFDDELMLLMMADYFVRSLDVEYVEAARRLCQLDSVRHIRLRAMPEPAHKFRAKGFGAIAKGSRYSLSLQPGIWETRVLYDLARDDESAHLMEMRGSGRTKDVDGLLLSVQRKKHPAIGHLNYYRKGKPDGVKWVRENVDEEYWPEGCR